MKKKEKHRKYFWDHFVMIYIDQPKQENNIRKVIPYSHPKTIAEAEAITEQTTIFCLSIAVPLTTRMVIVTLIAKHR